MEQTKIFEESFQKFVVGGVQIVNFQNLDVDEETSERTDIESETDPNKPTLSCSYCKTQFQNATEQREHYKGDWHRYNLKQNLSSKEPLTEEQFNDKTDMSSISGSDTTDEEDSIDFLASIGGKMYLKNDQGKIFSIYKCLLFNKKDEISDKQTLSKQLTDCSNAKKWCVLMLGGGHFAGAVFDGQTPILHKTFHCYSVRKGQGGSQTSKDNKSATQPKSAGASLRRYNEQALNQHVNDILQAWRSELAACNLIFYRASGPYNRGVLFEGKNPVLIRSDHRLRTVPFSTRRATFAEVKRVHELLSTVHIYSCADQAIERISRKTPNSTRSKSKPRGHIHRSKSREIQEKQLPVALSSSSTSSEDIDLLDNLDKLMKNEPMDAHEHEITFHDQLQPFTDSLNDEKPKPKQTKKAKKSKTQKRKEREEQTRREVKDAVKMDDVEKLAEMMRRALEGEEGDEEELRCKFANVLLDEKGNSALHLACTFEAEKVIGFLLDSSADLCLKNKSQQTPYTCTQSKEIRGILKEFAKCNPEKFNYNKAQIPVVTLTPEELEEKKRIQRQIKKEKEKKRRKEFQEKKKEEKAKEEFLMLSDREKRALAAERRLNQVRCFFCGNDITGKVPFEYLGYKFCSTNCVKNHRQNNPLVLST